MLGGYYRFFPGDYLRDTSGLSLLEHGAYNLLLHHYYSANGCVSDEKPRLYRLCGAVASEEQIAVDYIINRFFPNINGKLTNKRADEELADRQGFLDEQRRKGSLGGRPRKNPEESRGLAGAKAGGKPRGKPEETPPAPAPDPEPDPDPKPEPKKAKPLSSPDDLQAAWNRICTSQPKCLKLTARRTTHIKARLKEYPLAEWERVFKRIEQSPFCRGNGSTGWKATFDWIIKSPDNAVKVLEGKYDHIGPTKKPTAQCSFPQCTAAGKHIHGGNPRCSAHIPR